LNQEKPLTQTRQPLNSTLSSWKYTLTSMKGAFWSVWLILSLLICNLVQIMSLLVWPFSKHIFRAINRFVAGQWWSFLVTVIETKNNLKVTFWGDQVPEKECVLLISNHQCMSDIPALMTLAIRNARIGDLKFFVKDIIKYVPGVGWGMLFLDCLFVKRNWLSDHQSIERTFKNINRYKVPIWLVSFLEGTRFNSEKLNRSRSYAKKNGLWLPDNVLLPRTKGFVATVQGLRKSVHAIYDLTIGYPDGIPKLWQMIAGHVPALHIHVKRTSIDDIPKEPSEITNWVMTQFQKKNQRMTFFLQHGTFQGQPIE